MNGTLQDDRPKYILVGRDALALLPAIGASAFAVYSVIVSHSNNKTLASWPSRATIASESGLSARTVDGAIASLEAAGLLSITRRKDNTGKVNMSNVYTLTSAPRGGRDSAPGVGGILRQGGRDSAHELDCTELDCTELETTDATAGEQAPKISATATPKRAARAATPWSAFRTLVLDDYGQASNKGTQALATRIIQTAEHHGLEPEDAARAWRRWRAATVADDTARYWPIHRASEGWGAWLQERRARAKPIALIGRVDDPAEREAVTT